MKVEIKKLEKSRVQIHIEVPQEIVDQQREEAIKHIAEHVEIPGFRKGKVPADVLLMHVGEKTILDETVDQVVQRTYPEAVTKEKIPVVTRPENVEVISFSPFVYEVTVAVEPEVKLKNWDHLKMKRPKVS